MDRKDTGNSNLVAFLSSNKKEQKVSIPSGSMARLKKAFQETDKDGDGFLSVEELRAALQVKWNWRDKEHVEKVLTKAMDRLEVDKDLVLDWNEFVDMSLEEAPSWLSRHKLLVQGLLVVCFFLVAPLVYCSFNNDEGQWTVWDALYFAAVTVTTVGYGDLGPVNDGMRVFTIFYIVFGLAIVARIVDEAVSRLIAYYEDKMKQIEKRFATANTDEIAGSSQRGSFSRSVSHVRAALTRACPNCIPVGCLVSPTQARRKLMLSVFCFSLPLISGTIFFALNEDWPWLHAFYWSVVTCTTVGYGDLRLEKESSRIFSIFYVLAGFALVGAAIGNIGALRVEVAMERHEQEVLSRRLSLDMIADMDRDGNGVDRCEFVCAMLVQMGKVTQEDLLPLLKKFDELDADGSGFLTNEDLEVLRSRRRQTLHRCSTQMNISRSTPSPTGCEAAEFVDSSACSPTVAPSMHRMPSDCEVEVEVTEFADCSACSPTTAPSRGRIAWQEGGHHAVLPTSAGHLGAKAASPECSHSKLALQDLIRAGKGD